MHGRFGSVRPECDVNLCPVVFQRFGKIGDGEDGHGLTGLHRGFQRESRYGIRFVDDIDLPAEIKRDRLFYQVIDVCICIMDVRQLPASFAQIAHLGIQLMARKFSGVVDFGIAGELCAQYDLLFHEPEIDLGAGIVAVLVVQLLRCDLFHNACGSAVKEQAYAVAIVSGAEMGHQL